MSLIARIEIGKYLAADSRVCGGRLIFRSTRILVADALEMLADGYDAKEVARQYDGALSASAVQEAAALVRRGVIREIPARRAA